MSQDEQASFRPSAGSPGDGGMGDAVTQVIERGRSYAEAEIAWARVAADVYGRAARDAGILGLLAGIVLLAVLITAMVTLAMVMTAFMGIGKALLIVCGTGLLVAVLLGGLAVWRLAKLRAPRA